MDFLKEKIELKVAETELKAGRALSGFSPAQKRILIFCLVALIPVYIITKEIFLHVNLGKFRQSALIAIPAVQNPQAPQISDININQAGTGVYSVAAKITNPNLTYSLDNVSYNFVLYNAHGQQIYQSPATLYLLPGESKYLILPRVESQEKITSAEIKFPTAPAWQKRLTIPNVPLVASIPSFTNQQNPVAFVIQGNIYNNSPYQLGQVDINFLLRDVSGKILAASSRTEFTVNPFERRAYVQVWPGVYSTDVSKIDVLPATNILDENNLTLPQASVTPSSSLTH